MTMYYSQKYPRRPFYYSSLPLSSKLLISAFFLAMGLSISLSVFSYHLKTRFHPSEAAAYLRGNEQAASATEKMYFEKSKEEMAEVSHPHIFIQGLLLFVLAHLFTLTQLSEQKKCVVIVAGFSSYLLGIASPWLIRFLHPSFAYLQIGNLILFSGIVGYLMWVPFVELWWPSPQKK